MILYLLIRDSISSALLPYIANNFGVTAMFWRHKVKLEDYKFLKDNADIIVLEQVERLIPQLLSN